jgi:hypothetical protein
MKLMNDKIIILVIAVIILTVGLCGCYDKQSNDLNDNLNQYNPDIKNSSENSSMKNFIGTWNVIEHPYRSEINRLYTFKENGTIFFNNSLYAYYEIKNGIFSITPREKQIVANYTYEFSLDGNLLTTYFEPMNATIIFQRYSDY